MQSNWIWISASYSEGIMVFFIGVASILVLVRSLFGVDAWKNFIESYSRRRTSSTDAFRDFGRKSRGNFLSNFSNIAKGTDYVIIKGYLCKKGPKLKSWRKKYFVLDNQAKLMTFSSAADYNNAEGIARKSIVVRNALLFDQERPFALKLCGTDGSLLVLAANSADEQQKWFVALNLKADPSIGGGMSNPKTEFLSALSIHHMPVKHKLDVTVEKFTLSQRSEKNGASSVPPSTHSGRAKQYYVVIKFRSDMHDFSHVPVGQTASIKTRLKGNFEWTNQSFSWNFQDHECDSCIECLAAASATKTLEAIESSPTFYRGFPYAFSCQLWEATMLRNKKIASASINIVDLFGYSHMEQSNLTCSWSLYDGPNILGDLKLSLNYEAVRATGKQPFLTCSEEELELLGEDGKEIAGIQSTQEFFDRFLKDDSSGVWSSYYQTRGDTEIQAEEWKDSSQHGGQVRQITFRSLTHSPIGPSTTMCTETQHMSITDDGKTLFFDQKNVLHDIPYGDCFSVEKRMKVTTSSENCILISNYFAVPFSKGCMWKSKILTNTRSGISESNDLLYRIMTDSMASSSDVSTTVAAKANESTSTNRRKSSRMVMATSLTDGTTAMEEIFENQRLSIIGGWGAGHLLVTDRARFTNRSGDLEMDFDKVMLPDSWEWTSGWKVDYNYTECDDEGWSYASDFPRFKVHLQKRKSNPKKLGSSVRRRRWTRTMCKVEKKAS